jgi:hypothetical protein
MKSRRRIARPRSTALTTAYGSQLQQGFSVSEMGPAIKMHRSNLAPRGRLWVRNGQCPLFPPKADIGGAHWYVCIGPDSDIPHRN